ncbi:MAG: peptidylprolyl isomerase [Candidatus Krumholzibacteria bacterium]|jgi:cyclophilin family peptidyl-prolyl cis-trans isomerase|nr:peptidylprolyl isomerase [Candidatus Krumholzibacteria bacterium]
MILGNYSPARGGTRALPFAVLVSLLFAAGAAAQDGPGAGPDSSGAAVEAAGGGPRVAIILDEDARIVIETLPQDAPKTVERFLELVEDGFYDGIRFHRVEEFLVQAGKKDHDYPGIEGEMFDQKLTHEPGMVGLARLPDDYDSGTTQFYIVKEHKPNFNGEYTLFGRVVEGMELVGSIEKNDKIKKMEIIR